MKKIFAMILSICLMSSLLVGTVFGEENGLTEKVSNTLIGCEVIDKEDMKDLNQPLLRKEAAKAMIQLLDMENVKDAMKKESPFYDVPADDSYAPYIIVCSGLGVIGGDGDGYFRPEDFLSYEEGIKLLVSCLGYDVAAQNAGGYPAGYLMEAQQLLLLRDIPQSEQFTKAVFYTMIYNALQAKELFSEYSETGSAYLSDESFGERLMRQRKIITGEGVVAGNVRDSIYEELNVNIDNVKIGDEVFELGDIKLPDILGRRVIYYAKEKQDGSYVLTHVFKARKSKEVTLSEEDEPFWEQGKVYWYSENGRKNYEALANTCIYIYNGRPSTLPTDGFVQGDVHLVDHEGDGLYDLVIVNEAETRRVSYVRADRGVMSFKRESWYSAEDMPNGLKELDSEDKERVILLENAEGKQITLEDFAVDDVVTVIASQDGKHITVRKEAHTITGSVTSLAWDSIGVDGTEYAVVRKKEGKNPFGIEQLGIKGTFYLNDQNKMIYFVEDTGIHDSYGYIAKIAVEPGIGSDVMIKLVAPGRIKYFEETHEDGTIDKYLKAANDSVDIHQLKKRVTVNGIGKDAAELLQGGVLCEGMVIQYELNSEGQISRITLPEAYYTSDTRSDMRKFVTFSDGKAATEADKTVFAFSAVNKGGFKVSSEETAVFCVPPLPGEEKKVTGDPSYCIQRDEDYFDNIQMNNGTSYYTRAYDFEKESGLVRVFMIVSGLNANRSDEAIMSEPWSILQSKKVVINEEGEVVYSLELYSEGKRIRVQSQPENANGLGRQLEDLMPGDVFKFTKNTLGRVYELSNRNDIFSIATELPALGNGYFSQTTGNLYGKVAKIERKIIDESTTRYAHLIDVDYGDGIVSINASYVDTAIYIYDTAEKTIEIGTEEDIYSYEENGGENGSMIFAKVDDIGQAGIIVIVE